MTGFTPSYGHASIEGAKGLWFKNAPVVYFDDFITGGMTVVDLELANETGFYAKFYSPLKADATGGTEGDETGDWLVSYAAITAASQLPAVQNDADGGWIKMTTDNTSGEHISMQLVGEAFRCEVGRRLYFETRLKVNAATVNAFLGLAVTAATDPWQSRPAGFIAFTLSGDADIEYATANASTATASADTGQDIAADTFVVLSFEFDGVDRVNFFVNGTKVKSATATLPTSMDLSPVLCVERSASSAAAVSMTVDYVGVIADRARS